MCRSFRLSSSVKWASLMLVLLLGICVLGACGNTDTSLLTPAPLPTTQPTDPPSPVAALPVYSPDLFGSTGVTAILDGSGSTFAEPIYSKWFSIYKQAAPKVTINYQADGSGNGRAAFLGTPVAITPTPKIPSDFADSDVPFNGQQLVDASNKGSIVHIPIALGGVAVAYHLDGYSGPLRLSGPTLANIFLGKITTWADPAIVSDNNGAALPNKLIKPVIRTRGSSSGTTEIFTRYLAVVSSDFLATPGPGSAPAWNSSIQLQGSGNDEIAGLISQNDGAIGYLDLNAALAKKLPTALIRNKTGRYIQPTIDSVSAAAQGISIPDDFRIFIVNAEGENAYPIAGFTWLITWRDFGNLPNPSSDKAQAMANFLWWLIHTGQQNLPAGFSPLSPSLVPRLEALFLNSDQTKVFQFNGKPVFATPK